MTTQQRPPASTDVLVIGAGPAGLSAAALLSDAGVNVVVLDENARPGGQYYRQSRLAGSLPETIVGPSQEAGRDLIGKVKADHATISTDTLVWGVEDSKTILYTQGGHSGRISAGAIILATGAHERVIPFPGWTLPGVMTAGAAQTLLKAQGILPGKQVVIAGTGPFLYPVSTQLAAAGAELAAICELSRDRFWPLRVKQPYRHFHIYREALGYLARMRRLGLHVSMGTSVVEAVGDVALRAVVIAEFDAAHSEIPGTRRTVPADTLLTSFSFVPNVQIARLLGCELRWDPVQQAHFVKADGQLQTSRDGVYLAGEIAGIGGHRVAKAEGILAAASVLEHLGHRLAPGAVHKREAASRTRSAGRQFAHHMLKSFALKPKIFDLTKPDTIVCRCESVPRAEIDYHAEMWDGAQRAVKQCTRAGMGRCQGRMCGFAVAQLVRRHCAAADSIPAPDTARMPVKPLALHEVAPWLDPSQGGLRPTDQTP
ncbi:FAD/NAD(P)-binding oxidoreductase (plasmid) [Shinella yambaruensis]|uniref:FAD-dependent oxidoreductase n=1 Tax=Shinella yambaruensis TaxID=415996 RepID=UPI003D79EF4C